MIKIKTGRNIIMSFVLLISITFTTIVYSAYNTQLQIKGEAVLRTNQEIRITKLELIGLTNDAVETYNSRYAKDTTSIYGTLPANSSLTYQVTITNKGTIDYIVNSITQPTNNNPNVNVTTDLKVNDLINKSSSKTFTITLKNNTSTQQIISLVNQYKFIKEDNPTISMSDLPTTHTKGNNYPVNYTYTVGNSGLKETSCKSNISGAVNNLSTLGTGTHTITCTVTANSGKTVSASKTTTVTYQSYTMTNLVTNGSYEDGDTGWALDNATVVTTVASHGSKSLLLANTSLASNINYTSMSTQILKKERPTLNHIYYGRLMFISNSSFIGSDSRFEWIHTDAHQALMVFTCKNFQVNTWILLSNTGIITQDTYLSENWILRNFMVNPNSESHTDELVIVDLTETFGAGNEPSKEWCDANIKYFDDTITIYK